MGCDAKRWVLGAGLLCCTLAGCSLIFPFDSRSLDSGAGSPDLAADARTADLVGSDAPTDTSVPHDLGDQMVGGDGPPDGLKPPADLKADCALQLCLLPQWCPMSAIPKSSASLYGIWGTGPDNLWTVGANETILKYNPDTCAWEPVSLQAAMAPADYAVVTGRTFYEVWGSSTDVYVVGDHRVLLHFNGTSWTLESSASGGFLWAVGGQAPDKIFAVGDAGLILHRDPTTGKWGYWPSDVGGNMLLGVSGKTASSPASASGYAYYVVGEAGTLVYHDGSANTFAKLTAPGCSQSTSFQAVWASSVTPAPPAPEVVVVSGGGQVLHYNPTSATTACTVDSTLAGIALHGVSGRNATDIWAVGPSGVVARYTGSTWQQVSQSATNEHLQDVWVSPTLPGRVIAVGTKGTIIRTEY